MHAVARLRAARLARSTRPFLARGAGLPRCPRCRIAVAECICARRPDVATRAEFCLLMPEAEAVKPTNTGWLVADVVAGTTAFAWSRTYADAALLALLDDPAREPYVLFPAVAAAPERVVQDVAPRPGRRPLFVVFDATWAEAQKMFRKSPWLDRFPVLALRPDAPSRYRLRCATRAERLCTAEVAARCLRLAGEEAAADALDAWLDVFVATSLRVRGRPSG